MLDTLMNISLKIQLAFQSTLHTELRYCYGFSTRLVSIYKR